MKGSVYGTAFWFPPVGTEASHWRSPGVWGPCSPGDGVYNAGSTESPALLTLLHRTPAAGKARGGVGVPELFQACVWAGEPPLPQWPPAQAERGLVTQKCCPPPWTVCTFVQGGWAAFISPVVLEGPFRSSSSPRVLPGSKVARPGDSQSFGGSCQDSFQLPATQNSKTVATGRRHPVRIVFPGAGCLALCHLIHAMVGNLLTSYT